MLDRLISERTDRGDEAGRRRVALTVQRVARLLAIPALVLMLAGLTWRLASAVGPWQLPGEPVLPVRGLFGRGLFSPAGVMSLGLLGLVLVPVTTVVLILVDRLRARRWVEAAVALGVAAILMIGILLGRS